MTAPDTATEAPKVQLVMLADRFEQATIDAIKEWALLESMESERTVYGSSVHRALVHEALEAREQRRQELRAKHHLDG